MTWVPRSALMLTLRERKESQAAYWCTDLSKNRSEYNFSSSIWHQVSLETEIAHVTKLYLILAFPFRLLVTPTGLHLIAKVTPVGPPLQVLALNQGVRLVRVSSQGNYAMRLDVESLQQRHFFMRTHLGKHLCCWEVSIMLQRGICKRQTSRVSTKCQKSLNSLSWRVLMSDIDFLNRNSDERDSICISHHFQHAWNNGCWFCVWSQDSLPLNSAAQL